MKETELKACPFCGGEATNSIGNFWNRRGYYVECVSCAASSVMVDNVEEASEAWNKRT